MPHATSPNPSQDALDEILIQQALDPQSQIDFSRDLEPGEKADDAVDYEDLDDDDLAEDDGGYPAEVRVRSVLQDPNEPDAGASPPAHLRLQHPKSDIGFDDLFVEASPPPPAADHATSLTGKSSHHSDGLLLGSDAPTIREPSRTQSLNPQDRQLSKEQQLQQELFALSGSGLAALDLPPEPPANHEELLAALWPKFERNATPNFMELLPPKKAKYVVKQRPKPPKPFNPTKIHLEIEQDREKAFRLLMGPEERTWDEIDHMRTVAIRPSSPTEKSTDDELDLGSNPESDVQGLSLHDLQILCEDWGFADLSDTEDFFKPQKNSVTASGDITFQSRVSDLEAELEDPPVKRRRVDNHASDVLQQNCWTLPSLQDPERATAEIARRIQLDLNDSHLLVDEYESIRPSWPRMEQTRSRDLSRRYNISNDDAYDLLKENHQHKIRNMLGHLHVEHSLPALRLQWPFYKTRLEKQEARSFHRPPLKVNRHEQISFLKPHFVKKKYIKGKDPHALFSQTKDLSLGDNSNVLLLEYSEEHPTMLSNLGMGSKVVNHYRKKSEDDISRPKMDIGELNVLLTQDKSPFSIFGHADPGQVTPAIHNTMYRAPIFKQEARSSDFLVVRSATGINGSSWYLRKVDHLHTVGQEFPFVDVPGPHSRKVTTASKNRLRMISYRIARRTKSHRISVSEVTKHFIDTTDMQNRQKMKEFMQFDKDHKEWKMRAGESIPDEASVRSMVKPEDVCLLESMQVGQQHLQDAGFSRDDDDASEGEDAKEDENIEQQLAPWFTSRNFLNAAQGKAMLQLHGEGDPSGRGEALSFIKTSMKGGFRAIGESIAERIDNKKMKDAGGHSYNVARQQQAYEESIRRIWDAQKQSLSSTLEQTDSEMEDDDLGEASDVFPGNATPRSEGKLGGTRRPRDDETASQSTKWSTNSQNGKILEISRVIRDRYGNEEIVKEIVRNPRVIRQYLRRRRAQAAANEDVLDIRPGDDDEENKRKEQRLKKELARLERNKDRRIARDKQKGVHTDGAADFEGSPSSPNGPPTKSAGTQRKCANCGQVGHIKTNKKLCPMLNGTMKPEEGFSTSAFTTGVPTV